MGNLNKKTKKNEFDVKVFEMELNKTLYPVLPPIEIIVCKILFLNNNNFSLSQNLCTLY